MAWYDERQLGWERDTGDDPGVWTLKRLNAWFASAEEILQAEFEVESVPFPAISVSELTRSHLREVACIFGEDEQWTCIWTGKAFYYTNRKLLDHTNRRLLDATEQRGPREVLKRISKLGRHRALALVLLMRAHFIAETYKSRTGNEERLFDLAKDVEETGAQLIESIDHIGQTFASRYHAKKFLRTEGLVGWATEVGLLDTLATLRASIQVATDQSAAARPCRYAATGRCGFIRGAVFIRGSGGCMRSAASTRREPPSAFIKLLQRFLIHFAYVENDPA